MKILQEFDVDGNKIKGRITGNWSKDSEYGFKLDGLERTSYGEQELRELAEELSIVLDKIQKLNEEHGNPWRMQ